jgi:gamma-glutamyltranspeptidase/glutathione hydrolase
MGGPIQAQGHVQMVVRLLDYGQNPQAASDAPRWRVEDARRVLLEPGFPDAVVEGLRARGHDIRVEIPGESFGFGGAQLILATENGYVAGSDHRKDGQAVTY